MNNPKKLFSNYLNTKKLHAVAIPANEPSRILFGIDDNQYDITNHHALISLKPFAIAVNADAIAFLNPERAVLSIVTNERELGELRLRADGIKKTDKLTLCIYEADLTLQPISFTSRIWNSVLLYLKNKTDRKSKNFVVPPVELLKLFVYSLKPRPVFLVSVQHEHGFDAFPIDIAGIIAEGRVILSIRSTSAAIAPILTTKKICTATIPYDKRTEIYKLGHHHAGGVLPKDSREINFILSEQFKIPVIADALNVQEMVLQDTFSKGVHTQFIFRVVHSYSPNSGLQLAHTPWFNSKYFKNRFDPEK